MSTSPAVDDVDGEPASALGAAGKFGEAEGVAHPTATSRPAATATIRQARSHRPRRRREKAEVRWDICEEACTGSLSLGLRVAAPNGGQDVHDAAIWPQRGRPTPGVGWPSDTHEEVAMNQLIVVAFDHFDDAKTAMASLRSLERDGRIRFEDTAIVQRDPDGTAHVKNEVSGTTETAAVVGAIVGGFVTFMFPLAGAAIGAAVGAAVGAAMDRGVSADFIDEVKKTLRPGRSALFLVAKQSDADATTAALRPFKGEVIQTTLDSEMEDALRQALV